MKKRLVNDYFYNHVHFYIYETPNKVWWEGEINGKRYGCAIGKTKDQVFSPACYIELFDNAQSTIQELQTV